MNRTLSLAAALALIAGAAQAQDGAGVAQALDRFCLTTAGDRPAIDQAAAAAGWTPFELTAEMLEGPAVDRAAWEAPDGSGLRLITSLSEAETPADPRVRACIITGGPTGAAPDIVDRLQTRVGVAGLPTGGPHVWLISGTGPYADELPLIATGSPDAMTAAAMERTLLMITVMEDPDGAGAGVMRMSR